VSQQINLFNPIFMNPRKLFSLVTMLQALGLIVLGSGLVYGYAWYQVKSLTAQIHETSKRNDDQQARLGQYVAELSPQKSGKLLEDELKSTEAKLAAQHELIASLKSVGVGNTTGYSEYMRAFARQIVNGLWLTSFDIKGGDATQMSISGAVLSPELLGAYILRLNQEPVMRGISFASLQMQRNANEERYVAFTLQSVEVEKAEDDKAKVGQAVKK
jgi:hypothetical protein